MAKKKQARVVARKERASLFNKRFNPFELQVNRKKHAVLGKKMEKTEWGRPGLSRARAVEKRKKTLLREYRERNKTNQLVDRRFGEYDSKLSAEDRMLQRFVLEKRRRHEKANLFHLADEDELTHYGHTLGDDFEDLELQWSSDDEGKKGVVDAKTHFGGFLERKEGSEGVSKTRKEVIGEMVATSKQHRHLRHVEREHIEDVMAQVDQEWKSLHSLLPKMRKEEKPAKSDYDCYMRELAMEPRGKATDPLKTQEQQQVKKQEKLRRLQTEAVNRMRGLPSSLSDREKMASGDYIPDNPTSNVDDRVMLQYKDGKLVLPGGSVDLVPRLDVVDDAPTSPTSASESEEEELSESVSEEEEQFSDIYSDDEGLSEEEISSVASSGSGTGGQRINCNPSITQSVPDNIQEFAAMTTNRKPAEVADMLEQVLTSYQHSHSAGAKEKLEGFLAVVVGFCLQLTEEVNERCLLMLNALAKPVYRLAHVSPQHAAELFQKQLAQAHTRVMHSKGEPAIHLSELVLLQLVGVVFPTADFEHPVVTPALHFMAIHLSHCRLKSISDVCRGLLLCQTALQYVCLSRRLVPEVLTFLNGVLGCCVPLGLAAVLPAPFSSKTKSRLLLYSPLTEQESLMNLMQLVSDGGGVHCSNQSLCRASLVKSNLELLLQAAKLWEGLPSADVLFSSVQYNLDRIDLKQWPSPLEKLHHSVQQAILGMAEKPKAVLQLLRRKPKSIKFLEPMFEEDYQPGQRRVRSKVVAERMKLRHKYKRELKGSLRELRKDNRFLARERLQETLTKDAERRKKVKQIHAWLEEDKRDAKMLRKMNRS